MRFNIISITVLFFTISCGPTAVYGDYINSDGMTRKEIESIRNHPQVQIGISSYYGKKFHKKRTASGKIFNMHQISAAHKTLPLGTRIRVTNLKNGKSLTMTIIDRGPFVKGRILDVSYKAAKKLSFVNEGTTKVRIDVLRLGNNRYYK